MINPLIVVESCASKECACIPFFVWSVETLEKFRDTDVASSRTSWKIDLRITSEGLGTDSTADVNSYSTDIIPYPLCGS